MNIVKWFLLFLTVVAFSIVCGMGCVNGISFKANVEDNLKLAGDAPTIEQADAFLGNALAAMEARGLTSGNAALIFRMPSSDMGIWYQQIKGARNTTANLIAKEKSGATVTQLEKDNALMKIRETVLDQGESLHVTAPDNAWIYPLQWAFYLLMWGAFILLIITVLVFLSDSSY